MILGQHGMLVKSDYGFNPENSFAIYGKELYYMKRKWGIAVGVALAAVLLAGQHFHTKLYMETMTQEQPVQTEGQEMGSAGGDGEKVAYLTFDDGPSPLTEKYLDILKKYDAKATFFLIGQQIDGEMRETVRREIDEGHEVGVHTYTHESGEIYQSADAYYRDACKVKELLQEQFQYTPSVWRFPWGSVNCYICNYKEDIISRLQGEDMEYVDWNVSAEDSVGNPTCSSIMENIRKDCFTVESPVILMHDSGINKTTLDALESVVVMLKENGYQFGTISEREKKCHFGE